MFLSEDVRSTSSMHEQFAPVGKFIYFQM